MPPRTTYLVAHPDIRTTPDAPLRLERPINPMGSGKANKADRQRSGGPRPPREEVDRLLDKGRYKDAVKQAKLCYRDKASAEHHHLLERAYLLRARQLFEGGMTSSAREVAHHLIEFGVTNPELFGDAADLLVSVGLADQAMKLQTLRGPEDADPSASDRLLRRVADQAVLHPEGSAGLPPEIRSGASQVRAALEAVQGGDEEGARSALKDVSRGSPFSEWKRFALGLIAFRTRDDDRCRDAWDRLDPDRAPARIARALKSLDLPDADAPAIDSIEQKVLGVPVLGTLRTIKLMVAQDRWDEAIRLLSSIRPALRQIDPTLGERLTRILYDPLIESVTRLGYAEAQRTIKAFIAASDPLPIDPRWNRLWALIWEGPQGHIDHAEPFWRKYLKDLETSPALRDEQRAKARAIVLSHLGRELAQEASAMADTPLSGYSRIDQEVEEARDRAIACLEESLTLCPTYRPSYQALIDLHRDCDRPDEAAEVGRRMLEVLPEDFDTLMDLAVHLERGDDPAQALEYARRARALRPLDDRATHREWASRVSLARHLAMNRRYDEARAELNLADQLRPESGQNVLSFARKAALELKASRDVRAGELIEEARGLLVEPTPLWLALVIEARRYKIPKKKRDPFEQSWSEALPKKCRSETAGALADLLSAFLVADIPYTGRDTHVRQVADYLRRTTRLKYRREDLIGVCGFLGLVHRERKLFETLARKGNRNFPDAPEFPMMLGAIELEKGPYRIDVPKARSLLEKGLRLAEAQAPTDPRTSELKAQIQGLLTSLEDLAAMPMRSPFGGLPFGPDFSLPDLSDLPPHLRNMFENLAGNAGISLDDLFDLEDEFDDDDDESHGDEDDGPLPPPRPRPPSSKSKSEKKKRKR
jgi:tetratricopeptide (TPR) repeat protein